MNRRTSKPAVPWPEVGRETFDRCVEALISRRHPDDQVHVINGRGGDGGKDVEVTTADGTRTVYQLKYFPEGFSGPFKNRRSQIKRSFDSVLSDPPQRWVLVSPHRFTPSEWSYLRRLRQDHPPLEVDAWDQARLDAYLAQHTDLVDYMQRDDELLRQASILGQERAVLARPAADLTHRVVGLGGVVDGVDPHYTLDFSRRGAHHNLGLRPKHARAYELQPIAFNITGTLAPDDPTVIELDRAITYGSRITVPAETLKHITFTGTSLLDGLKDLDDEFSLTLGEQRDPVACTLEAKDGDGRRLHQARGTVSIGQGQTGDSVNLDFYGLLSLKLRVPRGHTMAQVSMDYSLNLEHAAPRDAEAAVTLSLQLANAATLELRGPQDYPILTAGPLRIGRNKAWREEMTVAREIASDLRSIGAHAAMDLLMPVQTSPLERVLLRILRRAYEGNVSLHPTNDTVTFTLASYAPEEKVESLLRGEPGAIFFQRPTETVEIGELRLDVEGLCFYHPNMALGAAPAELAELRRRRAAGEEVTIKLRSQDGTKLRVYMIEKMDNTATEPVPWGLSSISEPAGIVIAH